MPPIQVSAIRDTLVGYDKSARGMKRVRDLPAIRHLRQFINTLPKAGQLSEQQLFELCVIVVPHYKPVSSTQLTMFDGLFFNQEDRLFSNLGQLFRGAFNPKENPLQAAFFLYQKKILTPENLVAACARMPIAQFENHLRIFSECQHTPFTQEEFEMLCAQFSLPAKQLNPQALFSQSVSSSAPKATPLLNRANSILEIKHTIKKSDLHAALTTYIPHLDNNDKDIAWLKALSQGEGEITFSQAFELCCKIMDNKFRVKNLFDPKDQLFIKLKEIFNQGFENIQVNSVMWKFDIWHIAESLKEYKILNESNLAAALTHMASMSFGIKLYRAGSNDALTQDVFNMFCQHAWIERNTVFAIIREEILAYTFREHDKVQTREEEQRLFLQITTLHVTKNKEQKKLLPPALQKIIMERLNDLRPVVDYVESPHYNLFENLIYLYCKNFNVADEKIPLEPKFNPTNQLSLPAP